MTSAPADERGAAVEAIQYRPVAVFGNATYAEETSVLASSDPDEGARGLIVDWHIAL